MKILVTTGSGHRLRTWLVHAPDGSTVAGLVPRIPSLPQRKEVSTDPLVHGYAVDAAGGPGEAGPAAGCLARVVVAAGPDAGDWLWLPPGRWRSIGRDPSCDLVIQDAGMSRRHLRVRHGRDGFEVDDLGSTNGLQNTGDAAGVGLPPGTRLRAGSTTLLLEVAQEPPAPGTVLDGRLQVRVWPRTPNAPAPAVLTTPPRPEPRTVRRPSAWSWALPLVAASAAALLLRMPLLLVLGLLGPAMVLGQHLGDRRVAGVEHREQVAAWRRQLDLLERRVEDSLQREREARRSTDPGLAAAARALLPAPTATLWDRSAEELRVVVGEGTVLSAVSLDGLPLHLSDAPVTLALDAPVVVVGDPVLRDALVRAWILQLAVTHAPSSLAITVDPDAPPTGWDLLAWLPHTVAHEDARTRYTLRWGTDLVLVDDVRDAPRGGACVRVLSATRAVVERPGRPPQEVTPTLLRLSLARALVRRLAGLGDGPPTGHPGAVARTLADLVTWPATADEAVRSWETEDPGVRLAVPVGTDDTGSFVIDLARDGPHALVAGTTGAGKSELLRTLVTGLALLNRPSRLSLLLLDFKGGSSLGDCARLPHAVGLVTDLDRHLAERVLASLRAELRRREELLAGAGVRDVRDYAGDGLPRLVVVVDEFRVLAEELPDVLSAMVRVAAVGRSLGLHLVLATQRPAGIVTPDLRANVNLRVALRVRDVADSLDVLETAEAAQLPEGRPGEALVRTGASPPRRVRVVRAGPPSASGPASTPWSVREVRDAWEGWHALRTDAPSVDARCGLGDLPDVLAEAATQLDDRGRPVWTPPLPTTVTPEHLGEEGTGRRAWAVADCPDRQGRELLTWDGPAHLAVVGASRTGRSTALASLAQSAEPAWLYVLDPAGALAPRLDSESPAVRAWVGPEDRAHGLRVLEVLNELVDRRRTTPRDHDAPVLVLLDGWDRWVEEYAALEAGRGVDLLVRLLREGTAGGLSVVATGDRSLLVGRATAHFGEIWALRLNDPADLALAGLSTAARTRDQPPGRAVRTRDGVLAQVVLPSREGAAVRPDAPVGTPPPRLLPLPRSLRATGPWAVGGDLAEPVPTPRGSVLVLGPPRSGVSTTLRRLLDASEDLGLPSSTVTVGGSTCDETALTDRLLREEVRAVVVDDVHLLAGTAAEDVVLGWAERTGGRLLVGGDVDACATLYRGLVPLVARGRTGVLLQPTSTQQGAPLGVRPPLGDVMVPGRGVLVDRGRCTRIQVAGPDPDHRQAGPAGR